MVDEKFKDTKIRSRQYQDRKYNGHQKRTIRRLALIYKMACIHLLENNQLSRQKIYITNIGKNIRNK
jgi:hypothetical protein